VWVPPNLKKKFKKKLNNKKIIKNIYSFFFLKHFNPTKAVA
jgi:hypothetical protein